MSGAPNVWAPNVPDRQISGRQMSGAGNVPTAYCLGHLLSREPNFRAPNVRQPRGRQHVVSSLFDSHALSNVKITKRQTHHDFHVIIRLSLKIKGIYGAKKCC